jgi:hypothetical protein
LVPVEQRQDAQILRATGRFLRPDYVSKVCHDHFYLVHAKAMRVDHKLGVASGKA